MTPVEWDVIGAHHEIIKQELRILSVRNAGTAECTSAKCIRNSEPAIVTSQWSVIAVGGSVT